MREAIIEGNLLIVKRLLRRYPDLLTNIDSENGWSSLHYASYHGRYLICVYLIQLGHDKHELIKTFKGNTCVHLALMKGHEQTLHLLLQQFPQFINHRGENGRAPIHIACMKNYYQCLSLLIGVGADLWVMDTNGDTPLHVCLEYGSLNCMKMLVNEGEVSLDDNVKDNGNWKPIDVAQTFEVGNVYSKVLQDVKKKGVPLGTGKKPSSFRTPILGAEGRFRRRAFASVKHELTVFALLQQQPAPGTTKKDIHAQCERHWRQPQKFHPKPRVQPAQAVSVHGQFLVKLQFQLEGQSEQQEHGGRVAHEGEGAGGGATQRNADEPAQQHCTHQQILAAKQKQRERADRRAGTSE